jgi:hypothetical protein
MVFILNTLEVFPADCPKHVLFSSHAAYLFRLLFGPYIFYFGLGVPAYSQFIFIEYCYSRHPDECNLVRTQTSAIRGVQVKCDEMYR